MAFPIQPYLLEYPSGYRGVSPWRQKDILPKKHKLIHCIEFLNFHNIIINWFFFSDETLSYIWIWGLFLWCQPLIHLWTNNLIFSVNRQALWWVSWPKKTYLFFDLLDIPMHLFRELLIFQDHSDLKHSITPQKKSVFVLR